MGNITETGCGPWSQRVPFIRGRFDSHSHELVTGAAEALILKVAGAVVAFAFNVVLARLLGAEGAGLYFLAMTVASVAAVLGRMGLDNTLVRFTAANALSQDWAAVKGLYTKGVKLALAGSCLAASLLALAAPLLAHFVFKKPEMASLIRWMSLAVVPLALFTLHSHLLRGLKRIREALLVLTFFLPAFSLLGVLFLVPLRGVHGAVWAYILGAILTSIIGLWRWRKATSGFKEVAGRFETQEILHSSIPLFWVAVLQLFITWSSNILLGIKASSADVALFNVANQTSMLTNFILVATNSIAAPKFAALHRQRDISSLGTLARNSTKLMTAMATPVLVLFLLAPRWILSIFGPQFSEGGVLLAILGVGQFINVATGSVSVLLMMCGHERLLRNNLLVCALINLFLNMALVPPLGALGAAIATAATLSIQMLMAAGIVWWKLGILTVPIPLPRRAETRGRRPPMRGNGRE